MTELLFSLVDPDSFADIPAPAQPGSRCQTCDYWERLDGHRGGDDGEAARSLKLSRLMSGERTAGAYGMLAWQSGEDGDRLAVGWCQFGPISAYPRAQVIRDRYPELPDSPRPVGDHLPPGRGIASRTARSAAGALLAAVCEELDRRGIIAVEAYPEGVDDPWLPSPGPAAIYSEAGFARVAGDDRFPVLPSRARRARAARSAGATCWPARRRRTRATTGRCRCPRVRRRRTCSGCPISRSGPTRSGTTEPHARGRTVGAGRRLDPGARRAHRPVRPISRADGRAGVLAFGVGALISARGLRPDRGGVPGRRHGDGGRRPRHRER